MSSTIWNRILFIESVVLFASCYGSRTVEHSNESDAGTSLLDSGGQAHHTEHAPDAEEWLDIEDRLDAGHALGAEDELDAVVNEPSILGIWEGEMVLYEFGTPANSFPIDLEFTDTEIVGTAAGTEGKETVLSSLRYSTDDDQFPKHLDIEIVFPEEIQSILFVIPAIYKIEDDTLTFALAGPESRPLSFEMSSIALSFEGKKLR